MPIFKTDQTYKRQSKVETFVYGMKNSRVVVGLNSRLPGCMVWKSSLKIMKSHNRFLMSLGDEFHKQKQELNHSLHIPYLKSQHLR